MIDVKLQWRPVVRYFGQQVANTIHKMNAGCNPLARSLATINNCPDKISRVTSDYLQILAKSLEPVSSPNIEVGAGVPERAKVFV